jgi:ferredoxin
MKVRIDQFNCTGSGLCEGLVPEVFAMDGNALATVVTAAGQVLPDGGGLEGVEVPPELAATVRDAADACPGRCIMCADE